MDTTSKVVCAESVIGRKLLAFCPQVELLTGINRLRRRSMDFYWGKMCMVNENRVNSKIKAFSLEASKKT
jgi:hypothetical protein